MRRILLLLTVPCLLTVLFGCEANPGLPPSVLTTDPHPLSINAQTYSLTFYGLNFAEDAYLSIHGPGFNYYCNGTEYYTHVCPEAVYATYSFEDIYTFFSSFAPPPYNGLFRVYNVGVNGVNEGGNGDDRPSGFVFFYVE